MKQTNNLVVLGLGSNIGDRQLALYKALNMIQLRTKQLSKVYETKALLKPNSPSSWDMSFLNMVATGYTHKTPKELLLHIQEIEKLMGRQPSERWAPRIIDVDILFYNNEIINSTSLTIPHPELHKREFVLEPLSSIIPNYMHPTYNKSIKQLLEEL